ncbi:MAG: hypothetical protein JWQ68_1051 [Cryobacterium sp.]|nr:hypothetical protein [Cryobacterium sp.]
MRASSWLLRRSVPANRRFMRSLLQGESGVRNGGHQLARSPVENLVDEVLLIVAAGLRLSVKNDLIIRVLRDGLGYSEDALVNALQSSIDALIREKTDEISRLRATRARAGRRRGRARRHDDYRRDDVRLLASREQINRRLVERLRELGDDEQFVRNQLTAARDSALHDVMQARLAPAAPVLVDDLYLAERDQRMALLEGDLDALRHAGGNRKGDVGRA